MNSSPPHDETPGISGYRNRKRLRLFLLYCLILVPWVAIGVRGALQPTINSPLDWVDSSFPPRRDYDEFCERFGAGDTVVISWPECQLHNVALDEFTRALRQAPAFYDGDQWLFRRVLSGREVYHGLIRPPISMPPAVARERLSGNLIGPDQRTTCIIIFFNQRGLAQRSRLVPLIRAAAAKYGDAEWASQHLAGPIMDGYSVDRSSQLSLQRFAPLSSIVAFCACILCLDGIFSALLVFGLASAAQAVALAIIHHSGGSMTALLIVIPPLIQVLAISGGVHLANYYRNAATRYRGEQVLGETLRLGAAPCVLSAVTTAIGLGSLAVSGLSTVREFGLYAAVGVLVNAFLLLAVLPGLLDFLQRRPPKRDNSQANGDAIHRTSNVALDSSLAARGWESLLHLQQRFPISLSTVSILALLGLGLGTMHLQASVRIETLFAKEHPLIEDYRWLEQHVAAMVPLETVVHFEPGCPLSLKDRLEVLNEVERRLRESPSIRSVTSCLDFMPFEAESVDDSLAPVLWHQIRPWLENINYFSADEGGDHWRVTSHLSALEPIHYGNLLQRMERSLMEDVRLQHPEANIRLQLCGLMPLVHGIQSQLLDDLFASFLTAFLLIALVMTLSESGLFAGLIAMVPNVFPAGILFGLLGWLGVSVDIGSVMTASVAMGIAVDDTLHFLSVFRHQLDRGERRPEAVRRAYHECGRAMIQTTLICGSGLAIFAMSDFLPTARFAWMMLALLTAALIGDLVVLPALLLGPLGRVFESCPVRRSAPIECQDAASRVSRSVSRPGREPGLAHWDAPQRMTGGNVQRLPVGATEGTVGDHVHGNGDEVNQSPFA